MLDDHVETQMLSKTHMNDVCTAVEALTALFAFLLAVSELMAHSKCEANSILQFVQSRLTCQKTPQELKTSNAALR